MINTKNIYKNILLSLLSLIIFFGGIEIFLRFNKFSFHQENYYIRYDSWITSMLNQGNFLPDSKVLFKINPRSSEFRDINKQGFRDIEDYDLSKDKGIYRIACIGDSVTFGSCSDTQNSYPKILEGLLNNNSANKQYEVFNCGIPGYTSYQGLKLLEHYLLPYSLDLATISFGWNDIWNTYGKVGEDKNQKPASPFILGCLNLLERSKSYQLLEKIIYSIQVEFRKDKNKGCSSRVSLEDFGNNYKEMISLLKKNNINCIIILQVASKDLSNWQRYKEYCLVARKVAEEFKVPILHPDRLFIEEENNYFCEDRFHINSQGNFLIAKNIYSAMKKNGFLK